MNQISLNSSSIARALGTVVFSLVLASVAGQMAKFVLGHGRLLGLVRLLNVDAEQNIPSYFSVLLLLLATLLLAIIAVLEGRQGNQSASKWVFLSSGFLYLAYDEAFQVHEKLSQPLSALLGSGHLGVLYYAWVIPGTAVVLILALFFLRFLVYLPATTRKTFLIAAALYIGGSIGVELPEGRYAELYGQENLTYNMIATVEESLEMAGLVVFIWGLLRFCEDNHKEVRLSFKA